MIQYNFLGQRGNGTSSKSCHGTGRAGTVCQNMGRDTRRDNHYFFPIISCFGRFFPVIEHPILCLNISFLFYNVFFLFLVFFWESDFVPGRPGTEEFVPGHLLLPMYRDKGTPGREYFFVPGQKDFLVPGQGQEQMSRDKLLFPGPSRDKTI